MKAVGLGAGGAAGGLGRRRSCCGGSPGPADAATGPELRPGRRQRMADHDQNSVHRPQSAAPASGPRAAGLPSEPVRAQLAEAAPAPPLDADVVILEDYGKGVLATEVIAAALGAAAQSGAPVVVDPSGRDYSRYAGATVLTPNLKEASVAAGTPIVDLASLSPPRRCSSAKPGAAVAITREADGISLFHGEGPDGRAAACPCAHGPSRGLRRHWRWRRSRGLHGHRTGLGRRYRRRLRLANLAGRAVVRQPGVGTISIGHLLAEARGEAASRTAKVVDLVSAQAAPVRSKKPVPKLYSQTVVSTFSTTGTPSCSNSLAIRVIV